MLVFVKQVYKNGRIHKSLFIEFNCLVPWYYNKLFCHYLCVTFADTMKIEHQPHGAKVANAFIPKC